MVRVFVKSINELSDTEKDKIISLLSSDAKKRIEKKRDAALYTASLSALALLASVLGEDALSHLCYEESGRPYLDGINADVSISHSTTLVAVAVSDKKSSRAGVDLEERHLSHDEIKNIARRFFSADEQNLLSERQYESQAFLEIWTKKEALKKHLGTSVPFPSLDTSRPEEYGVEFITHALPCGALAICVKKGEPYELIFS